MSNPVMLANRYLSAWNERDANRRRGILAESWTDDATYIDPLMQGAGREQIDALIEAVQQRFPEYRFVLAGIADGHGDHLRFSWGLGPESAVSVIKGTDFALLEGNRFKAVTGFLDLVPAET